MYYQCIHQRLYHLTPAEYEDFTAIILHARKASYTINLCDKLYSFPCRHLCGQLQDRMSFRTFCLLWEEPSLARRTFGQRSQLLCRMPACPGWAHSSSDIRSESAPPSCNSWPVVQLSFKSDVTAAINSWCSSCFTFQLSSSCSAVFKLATSCTSSLAWCQCQPGPFRPGQLPLG